MIWKFYKADSQKVHYIMGTMHLATVEAYTFVDLALKYSDACDIYMAEMDLSTVSYPEVVSSFHLPDGVTITSLLKPHHYKRAVHIFKKAFHTDLTALDHFSPFYILNSLTDKIFNTRWEKPLDHYLWEKAIMNNKIMKGLESFSDQKDIMSFIPLDHQVRALKKCIKNTASYKRKVLHLQSLYAQGDIRQLYKSTKKSMGALRSLMIYDRNDLMLSRLIPFLEDTSVFVAVGAAHLPGEKGLLKGLKSHGYIIKQLTL